MKHGPRPTDIDKQATSEQRKYLTPTKSLIQGKYVSFFKTRVPTRRREPPIHPGQGCGIHSGSKVWHPECEARVPAGRGRAVFDRIFGSLKPGYQWRRREGRIMEQLVSSGPGPRGPGQNKKKIKSSSAQAKEVDKRASIV